MYVITVVLDDLLNQKDIVIYKPSVINDGI